MRAVVLLLVLALSGNVVAKSFLDAFSYESFAFYAPVSERVDNQLCRAHAAWMMRGVASRKLWALKMMDASTKGLTGARVGALVNLGNYDECLSVQQVPYEDTTFSGRHCLVSLGARGTYSAIEQRTKITQSYVTRVGDQLDAVLGDVPELISKMGATIAVCIPSSCTARDLEQHLRGEMRSSNITVRVDELACSSRADMTVLKTSDWCAIALLSCLAVVIAVSTILDLTCFRGSSGLSTSFSLCYNWRKLVEVSPASADNMTALSGVRVVCIVWEVLVHACCIMVAATPSTNFAMIERDSYDLLHMFLTNGTVAVEPFFLMGGLLVAYNFLKDRERNKPFNLPSYYLHRFMRLTPSYAMMMLMVATLINYAGDGPLWKLNMAASREGCETNWLFGLLYVSNYYPGEEMCMGRMGESWYLAVDMQMFVLSPLILFPLWRWRRMGKVILGAVTAVGLCIACAVPYIHKFPFRPFPANDASAWYQYYPTHTRFTPWLVGVGLGYALHATKQKPLKLSTASVIGLWTLGLVVMTVAFMPAYFFLLQDYVYDRLTTSLYVGLNRSGYAFGIGVMLFACIRGYGGRVNKWLSCGPMQILGRLTYAVYMVNTTFLRHLHSSTQTPQYFSDSSFLMDCTIITICCFALGLVLHLAVEAPMLNISQILRQSSGPNTNKKKT